MNYFDKLISAVRSHHGQSIVEITLITPLLLVALYIPADFGIAFYVANVLNNAARDGVVIGSVSGKSGGKSKGGVIVDRDFTSADADVVKDAVVDSMKSITNITSRSVVVNFMRTRRTNV